MQDPSSPGAVCVVHDLALAQVLMDAEARRWLLPFFGRTCSVADAARQLGERPNSVLYRVRTWCALGLLRVQASERRRGRVVRLYRTRADVYFVPHAASARTDLAEFLRHMNAPYQAALERGLVHLGRQLAPEWGVQVSRPGETLYRIEPALAPGVPWNPLAPESPPILDDYHDDLYLDPEDAKALQAELLALVARYRGRRGRTAYLCHTALAPQVP